MLTYRQGLGGESWKTCRLPSDGKTVASREKSERKGGGGRQKGALGCIYGTARDH